MSHHFQLLKTGVKGIVANKEVGILLCANGSAWRFLMNNEDKVRRKKLQIEKCTRVAVHPDKNLGAVFSASGTILVTDFLELELNLRVKQSVSCSCLMWKPDEDILFACFWDGTCYLWDLMHRQLRQFRIREMNECYCACFSQCRMCASTTAGLVDIPFYRVSRGPSPVLFSRECVIEFRKTASGAIPIAYHPPDKMLEPEIGICAVAGDIKCRFYAVAIGSGVLLLSRTSGKWIRPKQPPIHASHMCWLDKTLVIANQNRKSLKYYLEFYQLIPFEVVRKIELPSAPTYLDSDDRQVVCAMMDQVMIVNGTSQTTIPMKQTPVVCAIHSESNSVIVLTISRQMQIIRNSQVAKEFPDVSDFFIDPTFGLLFVTRQHKVFVMSLFKKLCLNPFVETSETVIGVYPNCSCLMSVQWQPGKDVDVTANQFFDLSVVSEMSDPDKAAETISLMRSSPSFASLLRQVVVFALREKLGANCVFFLEHFPEHRMETLSTALRAVESPERQGVFEITGPPSYLFMEFAGVCQKCGHIIEFEQRQEVAHAGLMSAALLLPVIMEEEGPLVGFPAALFILSKMHDNIDYIESLTRFLDPLLATPIAGDDGKLNCVGMIFDPSDYSELKARLMSVIDDCMLDLVEHVRPGVLVSFAENFNVDLADFFAKYRDLDSDHNLISLMDRLAPQVTSGTLSKDDCKSLYAEAMRGGWRVWTAALMLISGDSIQASSFISLHHDLKHQIRGSQWQHLIDT